MIRRWSTVRKVRRVSDFSNSIKPFFPALLSLNYTGCSHIFTYSAFFFTVPLYPIYYAFSSFLIAFSTYHALFLTHSIPLIPLVPPHLYLKAAHYSFLPIQPLSIHPAAQSLLLTLLILPLSYSAFCHLIRSNHPSAPSFDTPVHSYLESLAAGQE